MSGDGAHLGVTPERALSTILGGEPHPTQDEQMDRETFERWVREAPTVEALVEPHYDAEHGGYDNASRALAKLFVEYVEQHPEAHDTFVAGHDGADAVYDALKEEHPAVSEVGYTGFMWGWAVNAARFILDQPPMPNPAILTIGVE